MHIAFYYYMGEGGGLSNLLILLQTIARLHPEDSIDVVTSPSARFDALEAMPNVRLRRIAVTGVQEIDRLLLGAGLLKRVVRRAGADVLWSVNLGSYVRVDVPSVLSVNNPYQVHPWRMARYHPGSRARVAALRWFFRRSLRLADAVIVQTPLMGEYVRKISGAPQRISVAPKGVERERDVPPQPLPISVERLLEGGLGRAAFTFLYVSTWTPHKNHLTLLKAFSALARRGVRARVVLTVTPEDVRSADWEDAARLLDAGYVVPMGWAEKAHLRSLYAACDACLMPSHLESLSSAHLEAMQWERPQIAADLPYARDLCGAAALYVDPDDGDAWARAIETLIRDEALRHELVRAGREQMRRYPASWDEAAETVRGVLASVAADGAGRFDRRTGAAAAGSADVTRS